MPLTGTQVFEDQPVPGAALPLGKDLVPDGEVEGLGTRRPVVAYLVPQQIIGLARHSRTLGRRRNLERF